MKDFIRKFLPSGGIAVGAALALAALSACTDYVAQMESDFEAWASLQGDELPLSTTKPSSSASVYVATGSMLDDRDGQIYKTVTIGSQTWMAQNLNYAHPDSSYCYDNVVANCNTYGRLYTWYAAIDACPSGWHLPSLEEYQTLFETVGGSDAAKKKLKSTSGWSGGANGTDDYGFTVLPAGSHFYYSSDMSKESLFWTTSQTTYGDVNYVYFIQFSSGGLWDIISYRNVAYSVRCLLN